MKPEIFTCSSNKLQRYSGPIFGLRNLDQAMKTIRKSLAAGLLTLLLMSCRDSGSGQLVHYREIPPAVSSQTGAERMNEYLPLLNGKRVAVVGNQTSVIRSAHLVDTLLARGIAVKRVFAPEHGFRGDSGAGEHIADGKDRKTGLPIISLYGKTKKPTPEMLSDIDVILFDIQDVGARFYTYISTMHYVMEAAAESGKKLIILDRPNPNGFYIDGPVLDTSFRSFVGMHPIPVVHGCTVGELARMINGEQWLAHGKQCDLTVIPCDGYAHKDFYEIEIDPSPNLPSMSAIYLYPSLCFFEGTAVSVGRGTPFPFQFVGYPGYADGKVSLTPEDVPGVALNPPYEGQVCRGHEVSGFGAFYFKTARKLYLEWLLSIYSSYPDKAHFFTQPAFFDKLAGSDQLRKMIIAGQTEDQIRSAWQEDLQKFRLTRKRYLLYPDFE
jgi:uncharacterized protein YbbC (DUF1343 family)